MSKDINQLLSTVLFFLCEVRQCKNPEVGVVRSVIIRTHKQTNALAVPHNYKAGCIAACYLCATNGTQFHSSVTFLFHYTDTSIISAIRAESAAIQLDCVIIYHKYHKCHTSVDSGDLSQSPPKQSAVCSTCIIPVPPVKCQFIWMACAFGMSATQPISG